jgi:hypothetical protein
MATTFAGCMAAEVTVPASVTISVTNNGGGPTTVTLTAGTYATLFDVLTQLETDLNAQRPVTAGVWDVSISGISAGSTGRVTIAVTAGTYSITWTSTALRDLLGFTANLSSVSTSTGDDHAVGVWHPDCPLYLESGDYLSAPRSTDLRQAMTPTGRVYGHIGNVMHRHSGLRYSHVPTHRAWIAQETLVNESLERFMIDTQWAGGHTWFTPSSRVAIYGPGNLTVGGSVCTAWALPAVTSMESVIKRIDAWDGLWAVEFPTLIGESA